MHQSSAIDSISSKVRAIFNSHNPVIQIVLFLLWAALFSLSFTQWPLYSENQNTKFLIGMANAKFGILEGDWLASTVDPLPVFSFLVYLTTLLSFKSLFYLYHALLLGAYLYSLFGIADKLFDIGKTVAGKVLFGAFVIAFHSSLFYPFSEGMMGTSLGWIVQSGVANQYLLNPVLQPSTFGVLLIVSIYLYLSDNFYWAAAIAALAAVFHSTYLPSAAILTIGYVLVRWRDNGSIWRVPIGIGIVALLLVLPVLLYNFILLGPTSPEAWAAAQDTIVNFRIPHHSIPDVWIDRTTYVKIGICLVALICVARTRLFPIMLLVLLMAIGLTAAQMRLNNDTLAFIAPWRMSVFLVPLSTALIGAFVISLLFNRLPNKWGVLVAGCKTIVTLLAIIWIGLMVGKGVSAMQDSHAARRHSDIRPLWHFAATNKQPGHVYLVPTYMAEFRLETGVPVVITFKSHPYLDTEVIVWRQRVDAVNHFYNTRSCDQLPAIVEQYGVTHVVLAQGEFIDNCPALRNVHLDDRFGVFEIAGP